MNRNKLKLFRNLGMELVKRGHKMLCSAFQIKYRKLSLKELKDKTGNIKQKVYTADTSYWTTDWNTFLGIIQYEWVNKKKYLTAHWDCDDYANAFKSHMAEIYGLTSVGLARTVEIKSAETGNHLGWHRCCIIVASDGVFLFESMTNQYTELSANMIIGKWKYVIDKAWFDF